MNASHRVRAAIAALALVASCRGDAVSPGSDDNSPEPRGARIQLTHLTRIVFVESQITIEVYAYDGKSARLPTPPLTWSSDNPEVASVDANGRVTGHSIGLVTIRATAGDMEGSIRIDVRAAVLEIVTQQGPSTLLIGESAVFRAEFRSSSGKVLPTHPNVTWATVDGDLLELSTVPGLDASHVRVTGLATGLASLSVGVEWKQRIEIVGVIPERVPNDAPLRVNEFYFFTYWDDMFGYIPTMRVAVAPGRSVELLRVEVAVPGMLPKVLPPLCSTGKLSGGEHSLLGVTSYPGDALNGYSFAPVTGGPGAALLTYRSDDGRVIRMVSHGDIDVWGYGTGYPTQFPWKVCTS